MSFFNLQSAECEKPSLFLSFNIYNQIRAIEKTLIRRNILSSSNLTLEKNIKYMELSNSFFEYTNLCIYNQQQFWGTLLKTKPDVNMFIYYGQFITNNVNNIEEIYQKITDLNKNTNFLSYKYAAFLKNVIHDEVKEYLVLSKIENIGENLYKDINKWNCCNGNNGLDRKSTRLNSSQSGEARWPSAS